MSSLDPAELSQAAEELILAAAPERQSELAAMWNSYSPSFNDADDTGTFRLEAGPFGLVLLTPRTMAMAWLLAHEAWTALLAYGTSLKLLDMARGLRLPCIRRRFGRIIAWPPDQAAAESDINSIARAVDSLASGVSLQEVDWPDEVPRPSSGRPTSVNAAAMHDLACLSIAALFLHEVQHVRDYVDATGSADPHEDEFRCDAFARSFFVDRVGAYARQHQVAEGSVLSKRAMGLSVALYVIMRLTKGKESATHPPAGERVSRMMAGLALPSSDKAFVFLASLALAELRLQTSIPGQVRSTNMRDLAIELSQMTS